MKTMNKRNKVKAHKEAVRAINDVVIKYEDTTGEVVESITIESVEITHVKDVRSRWFLRTVRLLDRKPGFVTSAPESDSAQ